MIIVVTNVISEVMRPERNQIVFQWMKRQPDEAIYLTATSLSELLFGIEIMPAGKRKDTLKNELHRIIEKRFESRIIPFDKKAAQAYAYLLSKARKAGKTVSNIDAQIASIAYIYGFSVATRDTAPFLALDVHVINPWK